MSIFRGSTIGSIWIQSMDPYLVEGKGPVGFGSRAAGRRPGPGPLVNKKKKKEKALSPGSDPTRIHNPIGFLKPYIGLQPF
jgi:hypothetical protein